jgi:hypothetical protein
VTRAAGALRADDIPLTPDPETARAWIEQELAKPRYQRGESLADRFAQWLSDMLERLLTTSGNGGVPVWGYVVGALFLATVVVLAVRFWAPALRQGKGRKEQGVLDDDFRTADAMDSAAGAAARRGDWSLAFLERYRSIVRRSEERVIIDDRAGRTALEAARDIGAALPDFDMELLAAGQTFSAVLYGHGQASEADFASVTALAQRVAAAKPLSVVTT